MKRLRNYYVTERSDGGLSISATKPPIFGLRVRAQCRSDVRQLVTLIFPRVVPGPDDRLG